MPATRFFAMLEAKRELELSERRLETEIAAVSVGGVKWYEYLKERFASNKEKEAKIQFPDKPLNIGTFLASSDDAKYAVMSIFAAKKKSGLIHG